MGALEFEPAIDIPYDPHTQYEIDSLVSVASDALAEKSSFGVNLNDDKKAAIAEILRLGTSAGGQRAKVLLLKLGLTETDVLLLDEPTRNF